MGRGVSKWREGGEGGRTVSEEMEGGRGNILIDVSRGQGGRVGRNVRDCFQWKIMCE